jgi:hypothetical protein
MNEKDIVSLPTVSPNIIPGNDINPGQVSSFLTSGFYSISSFGYADNFDASYGFVLPFYVDQNVNSILQVYLNLLFQKYRAFSKGAAAEGTHTHTVEVTVPSHSHGITGIATDDEGTGSTSHQHGSTIKHKSSFEAEDKEVKIRSLGTTDSEGKPKYQLVSTEEGGDFRLSVGFTDTAHHHGITGKSTSSGGGTTVTPTSAAGSSHNHALSFGIYEAPDYPTNVSIKVDSVDITSDLGGPWNPTSGDPRVVNLDLTKYITTIGYHTLELSTSTLGRCIPLLWIKTQSKK